MSQQSDEASRIRGKMWESIRSFNARFPADVEILNDDERQNLSLRTWQEMERMEMYLAVLDDLGESFVDPTGAPPFD